MKKLSKKEIEQPDRFQTAAAEFLEYFKANQKNFYIGLGVLIIIAAGLVSWVLYDRKVEGEAQAQYSTAFNLTSQINRQADKMRFEAGAAIASKYYEEIIKKYPGTKAALIARYDLGNIYLKTGSIDKAIAEFNEFIKNTKDGNDLKNFAYSGLGYCYESKKEYDKAVEMFQKSLASKEGSAFAGMTYNVIASIYERQGKKAEALANYKKALEQKNEPMVDALIKKKIAELG